ncbi:MAG: HAMP domain-containing histidine kinase [Vicinamibacterales bacterium]|nr:HAMP domain-containing histidine kinase [Vicinamibacterales bacterium]
MSALVEARREVRAAPPATWPRRVVVIDDDEVMLLSCRRILQKDGYGVETFDNGRDGIARVQQWQPQLLLVDLKMPGMDGLQVIARVREVAPEVVIAVITGFATISTAVDAMKAGAYDFLPKPFTPDELRLIVNRGHERWRLAMESARLRREKAEAERRFITFVSHQLKSPGVAAKQYLDVLLFASTEEIGPKTREWLTRAQARLDEMITLIHDWLEVARLDQGGPGAPDAVTDLGEVVTRVAEGFLAEAGAATVTLDVVASGGPVPARGEASRLATVVRHLLANAIKFNRVGGRVTVRAACEGDTATLAVSDTGIGIPEAALPSIFDDFYRVKTEQTRDLRGSGLGLSICRRIVSALGGTITVDSRPGEGSTFVVRLPRAPAEPVPVAAQGGETWMPGRS